jgi:monoamine oxidase
VDYADDTELIKLSTNKGIFEADLVVCTLPLGVLKKGYVRPRSCTQRLPRTVCS